MNNFDINIEI